MATQSPLSTPWKIIAPDTAEHTVDFGSCINVLFGMKAGNIGAAKINVDVILATGIQFRVVPVGAPADQIDANNPVYVTTNNLQLTIHPNQELRFKALVAAENFNLEI